MEWTTGELATNFRDIERVNRILEGTALTLQALSNLFPPQSTVRLLDVGCGSGDIPLSIQAWGRDHDRDIAITAVDSQPDVLELAMHREGADTIDFRLVDAPPLPFDDGCFNVATSSLLLHHLSPNRAVRVLEEMGRVVSDAVVINDLIRHSVGYVAAILLGRATTRNRLTLHDGPMSIKRAYTIGELLAMLLQAGLKPVRVEQRWLYRVSITATV